MNQELYLESIGRGALPTRNPLILHEGARMTPETRYNSILSLALSDTGRSYLYTRCDSMCPRARVLSRVRAISATSSASDVAALFKHDADASSQKTERGITPPGPTPVFVPAPKPLNAVARALLNPVSPPLRAVSLWEIVPRLACVPDCDCARDSAPVTALAAASNARDAECAMRVGVSLPPSPEPRLLRAPAMDCRWLRTPATDNRNTPASDTRPALRATERKLRAPTEEEPSVSSSLDCPPTPPRGLELPLPVLASCTRRADRGRKPPVCHGALPSGEDSAGLGAPEAPGGFALGVSAPSRLLLGLPAIDAARLRARSEIARASGAPSWRPGTSVEAVRPSPMLAMVCRGNGGEGGDIPPKSQQAVGEQEGGRSSFSLFASVCPASMRHVNRPSTYTPSTDECRGCSS